MASNTKSIEENNSKDIKGDEIPEMEWAKFLTSCPPNTEVRVLKYARYFQTPQGLRLDILICPLKVKKILSGFLLCNLQL